jgi:nucleoside-diphosphate-sugar epimerase
LADAILHIFRELYPASFPGHVRSGEHEDRLIEQAVATGNIRVADRPDRYNVASADQVSNLELALMVAEIMGEPLNYVLEDFHTTRPGHDPHYGLDPAKLRAAGWKPPVPFGESLERTVRWALAHPEWLLP